MYGVWNAPDTGSAITFFAPISLAIALALASAAKGIALGDGRRPLGAFGELGLTGELRHAAHPDRRLAEAAKFGLDLVLRPGPQLGDLRSALRAALPHAEDAARAA